jgi:DNA-binding transcriptional ArsR family regulator
MAQSQAEVEADVVEEYDAPEDLPPSAGFVHLLLHLVDKPLSVKQLNQRGGLAERTTRRALDQLQEAGLVQEAPSLGGDRATQYRIAPSPGEN